MTTFFLMLFVVANPLKGEENGIPTGPHFSDPNELVLMDEEWLQKPISYDSAVGAVELVINIDQSSGPILKPIIEKYAEQNNLRIFINSGTCGVSNRLLFKKQLDIGAYCCPPGSEDRFPGLRFHTLGISPIIFLVPMTNPLKNLSFAEAQKIFMGELRRWKELKSFPEDGNSDELIQPIAFIHCKKRPGHWRLLLDNEDLFAARVKTVQTIPDMIYTVASNPRAIGFDLPYTALRYYRKQKGEVKSLFLDDLDPENLTHTVSGRYPLYRTFTLTTWEDKSRKNEAEKLVQYLIQYVELHGAEYGVAGVETLRRAGWKFHDDELVSPPDSVSFSAPESN